MPDLSIAIPTFNRSNYLKELLVCIRNGVVGLEGNVEISISDNASEDDTLQVVRMFNGLRIQYNRNTHNVGPIENVIQACKRSTGTYVLLMADDDLFCQDALANLISRIQVNRQIGVMTSPLLVFEDGFPDKTIGKLRFPGGAEEILLPKGAKAVSKLFLRTSNFSGLVIRKDLMDIEGIRKYAESLYPQMYLVGCAAKKLDALYLAQPLVKIRANPVKYWSYSDDFMAGAVLGILKDLTNNEPWGPQVQQEVTRKRILAAYSPLYSSRGHSWKSFIKVVRGLAAVPEYRASGLFWFLVFGIGLFGPKGIALVRRIWKGPEIDAVKL